MDRDPKEQLRLEIIAQIAEAASAVEDANEKMGTALFSMYGNFDSPQELGLDFEVWKIARSNSLIDRVLKEAEKIRKYKPKKHAKSTADEGRANYVLSEIATINMAWGSHDDVNPDAWQKVNITFRPLIQTYKKDKLVQWDAMIAAKTGLAHSR